MKGGRGGGCAPSARSPWRCRAAGSGSPRQRAHRRGTISASRRVASVGSPGQTPPTSTYETTSARTLGAHARRIPLRHDHPFLAPTGESPLTVTTTEHSYSNVSDDLQKGCRDVSRTLKSTTAEAPFRALGLQLAVVMIERLQPDGTFSTSYELNDIDLNVDFGDIKDLYTVTNLCEGGSHDESQRTWSQILTTNPDRLFPGASGTQRVRGWTILDGGATATRDFTRDRTSTFTGTHSLTSRHRELSSFVLTHTPG